MTHQTILRGWTQEQVIMAKTRHFKVTGAPLTPDGSGLHALRHWWFSNHCKDPLPYKGSGSPEARDWVQQVLTRLTS